ncbi:MAG: hypothetical protein JWP66_17 [Naasia sp.]|nr:hypothetical protein [Naasia sp.]
MPLAIIAVQYGLDYIHGTVDLRYGIAALVVWPRSAPPSR